MKKIMILLLILTISLKGFTQQTSSVPTATKEYFLKKSSRQKTTGFILLGGGVAVATTGMILGLSSVDEAIVGAFNNETNDTFTAGSVLLVIGAASMLSSVPFFIAAGKNKRNAMAATAFIRLDDHPVLHQNSMTKLSYPAIGVKINF